MKDVKHGGCLMKSAGKQNVVPQGQRLYEAGNVRDCGGKMPLIAGRRKGRKNRCVIKSPMSKAFPEDQAFFSLPLLRNKSLTFLSQ